MTSQKASGKNVMKIGDKVKVVVGTYDTHPIGSEGVVTAIETGWDDEGSVAVVIYIENTIRAPFLAHELEVIV